MAVVDKTTAGVLMHLALVFFAWVTAGAVLGYIVADYLVRDHTSFVFLFGAVALAIIGGLVHCLSYVGYIAVLRRKNDSLP